MTYNWFKKIKLVIRLIPYYIGQIIHSGNKVILDDNESDANHSITNEQSVEQDSVYKDLLNEQVTEKVKEFRHEMYYAERRSKAYEYAGGGQSAKKNTFGDYKGKIDRSDGFDVQIVQTNYLDSGGLNLNGTEKDIVDNATKTTREYHFTLRIERDFIPRFNIERFTTKFVVKRINKEKVLIDLYVSQYELQFVRMHKAFLNEMERIYNGYDRSDIIDFQGMSFTSYNAYGTDDLKFFRYSDVEYDGIVKFDGSYVIKFIATIEEDGTDLISEFYDEATEEKSKNHEMREGATLDLIDDFGKPDENIDNEILEKIEKDYVNS